MRRRGWVVVDLGFGDAGKGSVVDHLVRREGAGLVVRWNGGAQAGHNVVTADGRHHTFSQFGAGHFAGARTLLGPAFLLHPLGMAVEAEALGALGPDPWAATAVDARARVISPYQQAAGQLRERLRGAAAHGTCGVGVGECVADSLDFPDEVLTVADLDAPVTLRRHLGRQRERKRAELASLGATALPLFDDPQLIDRVINAWAGVARRLCRLSPEAVAARLEAEPVLIFEGAQGVLLDETWGFHPHTTWSDTTCQGALSLAGDRPLHRLGLTRAYACRHGAGPLPTAGSLSISEPHNRDDGAQGAFRTGALDASLLRYATTVCPVDALAVTCLDRLPGPIGCRRYEDPGPADLCAEGALLPGPAHDLGHRERLGAYLKAARPVLEALDPRALAAEVTHRPVWLESWGPTAADKRWVGGPSTA